MIVQLFKTMCASCNEEVVSKAVDMTGSNEIIIEFLDDMEFDCENCDYTTRIDIDKR